MTFRTAVLTVLSVVLASTASAEGWRKLQIDASSEATLEESVATFQKKLTPSRRHAFEQSLQAIWFDGARLAEEQQREYTDADYLRQVHGLGYEEVVTLADPTGKQEGRYRAEYYATRAPGVSSGFTPPVRGTGDCCYPPIQASYENWRGRTPGQTQ